MRRPKAPRRPSRRRRGVAFDRRIAAVTFGLAAVAMLATVALARTSLPGARHNDPSAAQDLEALMRSGERGPWLVNYAFTRTLADGRVLQQSMQEARGAAIHVVRSGSAMTIDGRDRSYTCNLVLTRWACTSSASGLALPPSEVLRVAVSVGAYDVVRSANDLIAGRRAHCFDVLATGNGQLPDLGVETDLCLAAGGVPLRQRVVRATGDVDERVARSVTRRVTARSLEAVTAGFDPNAAPGRR